MQEETRLCENLLMRPEIGHQLPSLLKPEAYDNLILYVPLGHMFMHILWMNFMTGSYFFVMGDHISRPTIDCTEVLGTKICFSFSLSNWLGSFKLSYKQYYDSQIERTELALWGKKNNLHLSSSLIEHL